MGDFSNHTPKALAKIGNTTLLEYKLDRLPSVIEEVIIVVGHLGDQIKEKIGAEYKGRKITYVVDERLTGTAHALWQAKEFLREKFLVMMGDDLYSQEAFEACCQKDYSIACIKADRNKTGSRVLLNQKKELEGFVTHKMYLTLRDDGGLIFTGLYSLTNKIFEYEPVKMETKDEWGLPHTLLKFSQENPVQIVETDFWLPVGTQEELAEAENKLKSIEQ